MSFFYRTVVTDSDQTKTQSADGPNISALTKQSNEITKSIDSWNTGYVAFGFAAVLVAFIVFFWQWRIISKSKQLSLVQADLIAAKDRGLQADLKGKDLEIAEANKKAADANERAGKAEDRAKRAEERAAEARQKAEAEHLESVYVEQSFAPRRLTKDQTHRLGEAMANFSAFVSVSFYTTAGDAEEDIFTRDIASALYSVNIKVFGPQSIVTIGGSDYDPQTPQNKFGVRVDSGKEWRSYLAANTLALMLRQFGYNANSTVDDHIANIGIRVTVGPRPQGPQGEGKLPDSKRPRLP